MRLMDRAKAVFTQSCVIITLQIIFISLSAWISDSDRVIYARDMYQLVIVGFLAVLPTAFLFVKTLDEFMSLSGIKAVIFRMLHLILTAAVVFGSLGFFGWMDAGNALRVFIIFLIIYGITTIISELRVRKLAKQLNERLDAFHKAENASQD